MQSYCNLLGHVQRILGRPVVLFEGLWRKSENERDGRWEGEHGGMERGQAVFNV